ncbi:hypothetical protein CYMTET_55724 [Cymbomonas tetramitiformis]|uniref:Uncharacterized protein n=1 Tax=Cymbomonas tetramitiformis TaxID=36881 RepID=A0AAE0BDS5_9CHLO|nr:hypothetical protein CYMTET_55724 [Cymbomonas tetramitiformis]
MSFRAAFAPLRRATTQMQMKSVGSVRNMGSAGATIEEEIAEMNKWKKITALAVPGSTWLQLFENECQEVPLGQRYLRLVRVQGRLLRPPALVSCDRPALNSDHKQD